MKVSIIVPVYNTEKYLSQCVDSILRQTWSDWELLLVDDGSTDGSGALCDAYAVQDERVRVFHQPNGGVSSARNYGVEQAQGDWVCYVDSDDEVMPDYVKDMADAIEGDTCLVMSNLSDSRHVGILNEDVVVRNQGMVHYLLSHSVLSVSGPVAKLFNRRLLMAHGLCFPSGIHYGEDMIYFFRYLNLVDTVVLRKKVNYIVRLREGSLSTRYNSFESEYECFTICREEVERLVGRLDVSPEKRQRLVWRNKVAETFIRCPKCLYAGSNGYRWQEKMSYLRSIPMEYYRYFGEGFRSQGFSSWIMKSLVRRRMFTLLLVIGSWYDRVGRK